MSSSRNRPSRWWMLSHRRLNDSGQEPLLSAFADLEIGVEAEPEVPRYGMHWGSLPRRSNQPQDQGTLPSQGTTHQGLRNNESQPQRGPLPKSLSIGYPVVDTQQIALPEVNIFAQRYANEQLQGRYHPEPIRNPKHTIASVLELQVRHTERPLGPTRFGPLMPRNYPPATHPSVPTQVQNRLKGIITPALGSPHLNARALPFVPSPFKNPRPAPPIPHKPAPSVPRIPSSKHDAAAHALVDVAEKHAAFYKRLIGSQPSATDSLTLEQCGLPPLAKCPAPSIYAENPFMDPPDQDDHVGTRSIVTRDSKRRLTFKQHLMAMDAEKAEHDLAQLEVNGPTWQRRDDKILAWLNQIPKEVDEDVNMGLLALQPGELDQIF